LKQFEETLKLVLNVESTKECMNILLFSDTIFHLWENILVQLKRCNILDGTGDVPIESPKPIGKLAFGCFANLKETQLDKLVKELIS
jgi:hypothetical protein